MNIEEFLKIVGTSSPFVGACLFAIVKQWQAMWRERQEHQRVVEQLRSEHQRVVEQLRLELQRVNDARVEDAKAYLKASWEREDALHERNERVP